jgi:hypothetical protein
MTSTMAATKETALPAGQLIPAEPNFLGMPIEIRSRIYHVLFSGLTIKQAYILKRKRSQNEIAACYKILPGNPWTILRTCKQVKEEVLDCAPVSPISYVVDNTFHYHNFPKIPTQIRRQVEGMEVVDTRGFLHNWLNRDCLPPSDLPNLHTINLKAVRYIWPIDYGVRNKFFYNGTDQDLVDRLYQHLEQETPGDFVLGDETEFSDAFFLTFFGEHDLTHCPPIRTFRGNRRARDLIVSRPIQWMKVTDSTWDEYCLATSVSLRKLPSMVAFSSQTILTSSQIMVWDNNSVRLTQIS